MSTWYKGLVRDKQFPEQHGDTYHAGAACVSLLLCASVQLFPPFLWSSFETVNLLYIIYVCIYVCV